MRLQNIEWKWLVATGYRKYQRDPKVLGLLVNAAEKIANAAGGESAGFEVEAESQSGTRQVPRVSVRTATFEARRAEARDRVLTRALDAGRG
jgi:hypothetical protein